MSNKEKKVGISHIKLTFEVTSTEGEVTVATKEYDGEDDVELLLTDLEEFKEFFRSEESSNEQ